MTCESMEALSSSMLDGKEETVTKDAKRCSQYCFHMVCMSAVFS